MCVCDLQENYTTPHDVHQIHFTLTPRIVRALDQYTFAMFAASVLNRAVQHGGPIRRGGVQCIEPVEGFTQEVNSLVNNGNTNPPNPTQLEQQDTHISLESRCWLINHLTNIVQKQQSDVNAANFMFDCYTKLWDQCTVQKYKHEQNMVKTCAT